MWWLSLCEGVQLVWVLARHNKGDERFVSMGWIDTVDFLGLLKECVTVMPEKEKENFSD